MNIDWEKIPSQFQWAAMDLDDSIWYAYICEPICRVNYSIWMCSQGALDDFTPIKKEPSDKHWTETLIKRPDGL